VNGLMASLPRRPKGLIQREVIDLPTTAPPLYSTALSRAESKLILCVRLGVGIHCLCNHGAARQHRSGRGITDWIDRCFHFLGRRRSN